MNSGIILPFITFESSYSTVGILEWIISEYFKNSVYNCILFFSSVSLKYFSLLESIFSRRFGLPAFLEDSADTTTVTSALAKGSLRPVNSLYLRSSSSEAGFVFSICPISCGLLVLG